jgi:oxygen-dependent protoporphyrinogen oxidase
MKKVAIIGSGIGGLSAAYSLEKKAKGTNLNFRIDLIEKEGRTGGNIITEKINDFVIEGGPDCVFSEKPAALKLCEELGLENQLLKTNEDKKGTFVYWKEKLHNLPEGVMLMVPTMIKPMLFSTLITLPGKVRIGLELFVPKKADPAEETLAQFVTRRFGRELLDKIAEPLVAGIHAGNPETMSIKSSFPRFVDLEENYRSLIKGMLTRKKEMVGNTKGKQPKYTMFMSLKDGLQVMTDTIRDSLKATKLKLNFGVASLEKNSKGCPILHQKL